MNIYSRALASSRAPGVASAGCNLTRPLEQRPGARVGEAGTERPSTSKASACPHGTRRAEPWSRL